MTRKRETAKQLCKAWFLDNNREPFQLTDGQADIFNTIFLKEHQRNQIITATQYGKSETVAMALILRAVVYREDWLILAGDEKKTRIIMGKVIDHLFDKPELEAQIDLTGIPSVERLKHERSKDRITFKGGGEIRSITADARNRKRVKETLTGQGARNIVQDESALIMDDLQAMVMRMLGGFPDSYLLKIGNPFYRNHFLRTWQSEKYNKVFIDYQQALKENRYTQSFIEEMRQEPFFDILYECKFPDDEELIDGFQRLIPDQLLENAFIDELPDTEEYKRLGADFAGGGNDRSAYVLRAGQYMWLESTNKIPDTMQQVAHIEHLKQEHNLEDQNIAIDYGGLGQGVGDRLHELDIYSLNIMFGQSAVEKTKYKNARAEMYYALRVWLENGGRILRNVAWYELLSIYFKTDSERKLTIQSKQELKKHLNVQGKPVSSPDVADAAILTFASNDMLVTADDVFML